MTTATHSRSRSPGSDSSEGPRLGMVSGTGAPISGGALSGAKPYLGATGPRTDDLPVLPASGGACPCLASDGNSVFWNR